MRMPVPVMTVVRTRMSPAGRARIALIHWASGAVLVRRSAEGALRMAGTGRVVVSVIVVAIVMLPAAVIVVSAVVALIPIPAAVAVALSVVPARVDGDELAEDTFGSRYGKNEKNEQRRNRNSPAASEPF
jgi:hypothetical protein